MLSLLKSMLINQTGVMFKSIRDEDYNLRLNLKDENRLDRSDPR